MTRARKNFLIIPPLIWLAAIWIVSSIPAKSLPSVKILGVDKLAHISEYLILSLLVNRWIKSEHMKNGTIALIYSILLANTALDELHQILIPNRSSSGWDLLANASGVVIGFSLLWWKYDRSTKPKS